MQIWVRCNSEQHALLLCWFAITGTLDDKTPLRADLSPIDQHSVNIDIPDKDRDRCLRLLSTAAPVDEIGGISEVLALPEPESMTDSIRGQLLNTLTLTRPG
ncbi:MAG: hypothetical protein HYW51_00985 [Candidatus Doudnabacteria bacterium]|nr:hypothetical protein [Candidatus Doudnabacteria bacterium]